MDLSVLDRQRAVLQRRYQSDSSWQQNHENQHSDLHSVFHRQQLLSQFLHTDHQSPKPDWQCNSSLSPNKEDKIYSSNKKRKAEFDVEEERKDKGVVEAEEAGEEKSEITTKTERGISSNTCSKNSSKVSKFKKPDYIHVRAQRGQATDSHSLAERARREKISKKMKCLQDLVPGCHKVIGKAGMLDEIINYVQSLQKQVEFLSMKLATVNPRFDFTIDNIFANEMPPYLAILPPSAHFESTNSTCFHYNTIGTSSYGDDMAMDQSQMLSQKAGPIPEVFLDSYVISQLQQLSGCEPDWPNLFN